MPARMAGLLYYYNCINTLAPGFTQFFWGSQIAVNAPYEVVVEQNARGTLVFRSVPHLIKELYPRAWQAGANVSKVARYVQVVVFPYVAGVSYG